MRICTLPIQCLLNSNHLFQDRYLDKGSSLRSKTNSGWDISPNPGWDISPNPGWDISPNPSSVTWTVFLLALQDTRATSSCSVEITLIESADTKTKCTGQTCVESNYTDQTCVDSNCRDTISSSRCYNLLPSLQLFLKPKIKAIELKKADKIRCRQWLL
jgi:hypothetical protein